MELIALSSPDKINHESQIIHQLFDAGLDSFHLRKPGFSEPQVEQVLNSIDPVYHHRIVLHGYSGLALKYKLKGIHLPSAFHQQGLLALSRRQYMSLRFSKHHRSITCHSLERLLKTHRAYSSLVLSPVFNTISDHNISAGFDEKSIKKALQQVSIPVVALGGIDARTIVQAKDMGFSGAMLQGALWRHDHPVETFTQVKQALRSPVRESFPLSVVKGAVRSA